LASVATVLDLDKMASGLNPPHGGSTNSVSSDAIVYHGQRIKNDSNNNGTGWTSVDGKRTIVDGKRTIVRTKQKGMAFAPRKLNL
jgi:hypothetical protein